MPYSVQFVGLVCFLRDQEGKQALLPDGRNPDHGIDPHYGSIVVDPATVATATRWDSEEMPIPGTFMLPPCSIAISGAGDDGVLDTQNHDGRLPQLRSLDPNFAIDVEQAQTIARMQIRRGTLYAYQVPGGTAIISELFVPHDDAIRVTVTPRDGSPMKTIDLVSGTEIAITNTARAGYVDAYEPNDHFRIYEKLSVNPVSLSEPSAEMFADVPPSPSHHVMFSRPTPIGLTVSCSNTGCCDS